MSRWLKDHWKNLLFLLGILLIVTTACKKSDTTEPEGNPPEVPPLSSFVMDFSDFASSDTTNLTPPGIPTITGNLSYQNWWWSAVNVGVWNVILSVTLLVPKASFVAAFQHQPVQQPDGSWVWSYDFTAGGITHRAALHGSIDNDGTKWKMFITKQGAYDNFLWYSGEANLLLTEGFWLLNNKPSDQTPFLRIDWHRNLQDSTADIKYTNIVPGGAENGGYIFYGTTTDTTYDAFYDIYNKGKNNHTNIEWNRQSKAGRVKDPLHFGDSNWHCWDNQLQNIQCP